MLALKSFLILGAATLAAAGLGRTCIKDTVAVDAQGVLHATCGMGHGAWNSNANLDLNKCFKRSGDSGLDYAPNQDGSDVTDCIKNGDDPFEVKPFDKGMEEMIGDEYPQDFTISGACLGKGLLDLKNINNLDGTLVCSSDS
ncbi:hypothetical protein NUU61_004138 [Penicillium alfredii]|uniref:Cyanovirin-N domain-containing protein n=1 Tax=Penicillium alfredii TaxID=1506179 RepID=A0A9W9FKJ8_9EURO|nr:uncharacterized protein NUU61_004138 [Penicillium alfredii]KAJ5101916.1 hypothetical protein NUU61_004138 [Penicillium alfredii]